MRKEREERNVSETDFDIIVVGSGCAGAVAAYTAASAGKSVLCLLYTSRRLFCPLSCSTLA